MKLSEIVKGTGIRIKEDIEINGISINSKEVKENFLFVAIKGYIRDGHDYVEAAFKKGASIVIVDSNRYDDFKDLGYVLKANDTRSICSIIACNYYGDPSKSFKLIGITGTKGKTSTSFMIRDILMKAGKSVGMITTVGTYLNNNKLFDNDRTTPEPFTLQKSFKIMKDIEVDYVIMEVSSQSLKLGRVDHSHFDIGMFLNLSEEHVSKNEHKDMKEYFLCKAKLFDMVKIGFINVDDKKGRELIKLKPECNFKEISLKQVKNINIDEKHTSFTTLINDKEENVKIPILGKYAIYNALFGIRLGEMLKIDSESIIEGLERVRIPGRSEIVKNNLGLTFMIDYAHNAKSLESILKSIKEITKGRLIAVFGCAGNRGKVKRKEMGKIAGNIADYTIITSDNPGTEDPNQICLEIEEGIKEITNNYEIVVDREKAIKKAAKIAKKEDIILLAGKGHEKYQIIGEDKVYFSEREIIKGLE